MLVRAMKCISRKNLLKHKLDKNTELLSSAIIQNGIDSVSLNRNSLIRLPNTFSNEVKTGKITNQERSGRCWMFAGLNLFRQRVAKKCNIKDFELSQSYVMFWDKLEKANYFLENIIETRNEKQDSRLLTWLLTDPVQDGGQWDMLASLIDKYGVVPKAVMPETFDSKNPRAMNQLLTLKLRQNAIKLRKKPEKKEKMISEIYQMLVKFFGEPPTSFDFEYKDKKEKFHRDRNLTPKTFFKKYVNLKLDDFISIVNAPTKNKPFEKTFTVKYLGNVIEGKKILYLNVNNQTMKDMSLNQLKTGMPVWFGCDIMKMMESKTGLMDSKLFLYEDALKTDLTLGKGERLDYGESKLTHAMVFTGVNLIKNKPNRWKVENSWGEKKGKNYTNGGNLK